MRCRAHLELAQQARLADAGVAAHDDQAAAPELAAAAEQGIELLQLLDAPDEGPCGFGLVHLAANAVRHDRLHLALDGHRGACLGLEQRGDFAPGVGTDHHLVFAGQAAQACRGVDRVSRHGELPGARIAAPHHDPPGAGAGVHAQAAADARRHFGTDGPHGGVQLERGPHRPRRIAAPRQRHTVQRHDLVADELVDDAAMPLDDGHGLALDAHHQRLDFFRVEALVERGVARQVGKGDRRVAPFAAVVVRHGGGRPRGWRCGRECEPAGAAKARLRRHRLVAGRALQRQRASTLAAEARACRVLERAGCAVHRFLRATAGTGAEPRVRRVDENRTARIETGDAADQEAKGTRLARKLNQAPGERDP